ncbi:DALR anticodon-binding domain-containing protein 3 isoform X1 [Paramormyrops kingsleyae]|uniref:DALR anticodon-binding domain-containing protein 3 isoform X1 n=1 Tax=Paramormyrops kingsleyae TaxID=1676925 RepID=UPI003B97CC48
MEGADNRPFRIGTTVRALNSALRGEPENVAATVPDKRWFKESSAKNLRNRDFLSPSSVLTTLYADGQVPATVLGRVLSVGGNGVLPIAAGEVIVEGLRLRVDRVSVFREVLGDLHPYLKPSGQGQGHVVLNCPALYPKRCLSSCETITLGQLRTVLLADHQAVLLKKKGFSVSFCPALPEGAEIVRVLKSIGVEWPTVPVCSANGKREEELWGVFKNSPYRDSEEELCGGMEMEGGGSEKGTKTVRINLKKAVQEKNLQGYDPNLGVCTVQEESVYQLGQLEAATAVDKGAAPMVLHVTSSQDEFRQQQVDVLWRVGGARATQKHMVCGPVKTPGSQINAMKYIQLRKAQMKEASEIKYGEKVEGQAWDDIIQVMTSATVRFELLSTVHSSPVTLDVQREGGVSTKGPKGGVFVMYNCARLHTLFTSYEHAVKQGLYPEIPNVSHLDFSSLKEEGEWLLLFNYLIPFSDLLDQLGQSLEEGRGGARVGMKTEQICRFLVSLSKDFSSYYNRVHVLGEPMPHLYNQMFCRLQLLGALRELYHCALDTLHLPPIPQL